MKTLETVLSANSFEQVDALFEELCVEIPELRPLKGLAQNPKFHSFDVWEHSVRVMLGIPKVHIALRLAALLHDIGKPLVRVEDPEKGITFYKHAPAAEETVKAILERVDNIVPELKPVILAIVVNHELMYTPDWSDKAVRKLAAKVDHNWLCEHRLADLAAQNPTSPHVAKETEGAIAFADRATKLALSSAV